MRISIHIFTCAIILVLAVPGITLSNPPSPPPIPEPDPKPVPSSSKAAKHQSTSSAKSNPAPKSQNPSSKQVKPTSPKPKISHRKQFALGNYKVVITALKSTPLKKLSLQDAVLLAKSHLNLNQPKPALPILKHILSIDEDHADANRLLGRALFALRQFASAIRYLKTALRLHEDPAISFLLAQSQFQLKQYQLAKKNLQLTIELNVADPRPDLLLARIYLQKQLGALAEKHLLAAKEKGINSYQLNKLLGHAYLLQQKYTGPITSHRLAKKTETGVLTPHGIVLRPIPGRTNLYQLTSIYSAIHQGYILLAKNPTDPDALYMITRGYVAVDMLKQAKNYLDKLTAVEKDSPRLLLTQAQLAIRTANHRKLHTLVKRGLKSKSLDIEHATQLYYQLALQLRATGARPHALTTLKHAESLQPTSSKTLRLLADLHLTNGKAKQAVHYLTRLIELYPDASDINKLKNQLRTLTNNKGGS